MRFPPALLFLTILVCARADTVADAQAAFTTMLAYQKTDDPRSPALFAPDCIVTFTFTDGLRQRSSVIPGKVWQKMLVKMLAEKRGNHDVYENVRYTPEGSEVRVDGTILSAGTAKREPFSMVYARNDAGILQIQEMAVTSYVPDLPAP